ncbi:hypothetical protein CRE_24756 [Caenorhabditis remanei]|uniref:Uncharacterized protein n=1 Tax=Caenorhabditis remanei TaxID=31234 RepID=E3N959_CAERE|nr:hypothetical protein CRE_24756 [Caenorhabditis remanei]
MVTSFYEPKAKFAAKVVGKCHKEGVVLVDTHAEYDKPHKKFFCLKEKTPTKGDLVDVVNDKGVEEPGTVVDCPDPKMSIFCVATKKANKHGHVFSGDKENYSLIGVTLGHVDKKNMILEVFSLAEHHDEICKTTGVCNT